MTVSACGGLNSIYSTDSDEDRSLRNPCKSNIEHWIKVISNGQNIRWSSFLATFWTVNDLDRFQDDMAERETLERERLGQRERGIETERQADGFTLLIIKLH